ncbi:MAG: 3'-5' exonuclease [Candidatus Doudnabacteria bacterium]|nr:3'-5' exonuclease [Candidatus Doudnabacteria bacterium]
MIDTANFTIVDVETTGGNPYFNRIIEIGILRVEKGEVVAKYQTLLNPLRELPEFITKLTGLRDEDLIDAPTFEDKKDEILELFEDSVFVAHNVGFDYDFIKEEFRRVGYGFDAQQLCTVRLSRALFPKEKHHNLGALIERYNFSPENRHRAFDDAQVLWNFLQMLNSQLEKPVLTKALERTLKKISPKKQQTMTDEIKLEYVPLEFD